MLTYQIFLYFILLYTTCIAHMLQCELLVFIRTEPSEARQLGWQAPPHFLYIEYYN